MGTDDSHLDFRVILKVGAGAVSCTTQVRFHSRFGRLYFAVIKPFHRIIVPAMLRSALRQAGLK